MGRVLIGDLLTGRRYVDVPYVTYSWSKRRNRPETISATVTLKDPDVRELQLRNAATPGKSYMAIVEEVNGGDWFPGAGQLSKPSYQRDSGTLEFAAPGIFQFFSRRSILPPLAASIPVAQFLVPDPSDTTKTMPNPLLATNLSGLSLGTIVKRLVEQALSWPSGTLPIVLPADIAGIHVRNYDGTEFKTVLSAIQQLIGVIGGPDVTFDARYQPDRRGVEWVLRTGTDTQPLLRSQTIHRWDLTVENTSTRDLKVDYDGDELGSLSWGTGGRSADLALVERATNPMLTDAGYPLMEIVDTTHTDVSVRSTLQGYAAENLARGQGVTEVLTFQAKKDEAPFLGQYDIGDLCQLIVRDDPYIPDSPPSGYLREIASISGDESNWVTIQTTEAVS